MKASSNNTYPRVGVGVLIFDQDKLLLGQRQQNHGESTWGPPGGHLEFGEQFQECACREVKEETGLIINSPTLLAVTNDIFVKENKHYVSILLKADFLKDQTIQNLEPHKVDSWQWFPYKPTTPTTLLTPKKPT